MTRPCMIQVTSGKQHNLAKATYPGESKDGMVTVKHAGGVLQVLQTAIISMAWGAEDPPDPNAAQMAQASQPPPAPAIKAAAGKAL